MRETSLPGAAAHRRASGAQVPLRDLFQGRAGGAQVQAGPAQQGKNKFHIN